MENDFITLPSGKQIEIKVYSQYTDDELKDIIKESPNISHILSLLKLNMFYHRYFMDFINKNKIDISHFTKKEKKSNMEQKLIKNTTHHSSKPIKEYLVKKNIVENKCSVCSISSVWNNKPLTLQLDHINGDHFDYRVENLRLICPNCHSQTETYTGRNLRLYKQKECSVCKKNIRADNTSNKCSDCIHNEKHLCSMCKVKKRKGHYSKCKDCLTIKRDLPLCNICNKPIVRATNLSGSHKKCYRGDKKEESSTITD